MAAEEGRGAEGHREVREEGMGRERVREEVTDNHQEINGKIDLTPLVLIGVTLPIEKKPVCEETKTSHYHRVPTSY